MFDSLNRLPPKLKYLPVVIPLLFAAVLCVVFFMADDNDFDTSRREVLLRRIGDQVLSQSGDHASRVLPVKKIAKNEYQIRFEKELMFEPASLVNITNGLLHKDPLTNDYVVNVLNSGNSTVAYSYAMSKNKKNDIVPCLGRKQPKAPYLINIKFKPTGLITAKSGYLLYSLPVLAFVGFFAFRSKKSPKILPDDRFTDMLTLGAVLFDVENQKLSINGKGTDLTGTETRLLRIFALSPNEVIERSRLQKEIWEDEGVIVGRSLDMFISKLRKKLEVEPSIKIAVIRGKGYKLNIG